MSTIYQDKSRLKNAIDEIFYEYGAQLKYPLNPLAHHEGPLTQNLIDQIVQGVSEGTLYVISRALCIAGNDLSSWSWPSGLFNPNDCSPGHDVQTDLYALGTEVERLRRRKSNFTITLKAPAPTPKGSKPAVKGRYSSLLSQHYTGNHANAGNTVFANQPLVELPRTYQIVTANLPETPARNPAEEVPLQVAPTTTE